MSDTHTPASSRGTLPQFDGEPAAYLEPVPDQKHSWYLYAGIEGSDPVAKLAGGGLEISMSGPSYPVRSFISSAITLYPSPEPEAVEAMASDNAQVTVLRHKDGRLKLTEGRLWVSDTVETDDGSEKPSKFGLLPKGARAKGVAVFPEDIVDVRPGWGEKVRQDILETWQETEAVMQPVTKELLKEIGDDPGSGEKFEQKAEFLFTHPGFDGEGRVPGCRYRADYYMPEDDIVGGYLEAPEDSYLYSEFGSVYGSQLIEWGAVKVPETELPVELRPQEQEIDWAAEHEMVIATEMGDQIWDNSFWEQDLGPDSDYGPEL